MLNKILDKIGIPNRESRFIEPPAPPFIVYFDGVQVRGADAVNLLKEHACTLELYTDKPDKTTISKMESVLDSMGIPYEKSEQVYLKDQSYYMTTFDFDYIEKKEV